MANKDAAFGMKPIQYDRWRTLLWRIFVVIVLLRIMAQAFFKATWLRK